MSTSQTHRPWINFKELRTRLRFEDVLGRYKVEIQREGDQHKGPCPLPGHTKSRNAPTFSANLERGIFRCFGCRAQGNVLEFAALMEGVDPKDGQALRGVAVKLQAEFFPEGASRKTAAKHESGEMPVFVNAPIDFSLKDLDADHPSVAGLGVTGQIARHFGVGFCSRGLLAGRIAIPLHDADGRLVGYAGRIEDEGAVSKDNPRYILPSKRERDGKILDFDPSSLLYNFHRLPESIDTLTVFDDFTAVWASHSAGREPAVAIINERMSRKQVILISTVLSTPGTIQLVTANERLAREFLPLSAEYFAVRWLKIVRPEVKK